MRQDEKRHEASLPDCLQALKQAPDNTDAIYCTARARNEPAQFAEALRVAKTGLDLKDYGGRIFAEAIYANWRLGQVDTMAATIARGLKLYPEDKSIILMRDWIAARGQ